MTKHSSKKVLMVSTASAIAILFSAILLVSPPIPSRIQEEKDIVHQTVVEETRRKQQARLAEMEDRLNFENDKQSKQYEYQLAEIELAKKAAAEAYQLRSNITQEVTNSLIVRMKYDAEQSDMSIQEIIENIKALYSVLQPNLPQISSRNTTIEHDQIQSRVLESGQSDHTMPQIIPLHDADRNQRYASDAL